MKNFHLGLVLFFFTLKVFAEEKAQKHGYVPSEFESDGGHVLGLNNGGMAAVSGQSSVKANPAMLVLEKQYTFSGGYNWPAFGRPFYQVGVVDSKTSKVAAGFTYTGFSEKFGEKKPIADENSLTSKTRNLYDTPIDSRLALGLAQVFGEKVSLGANFQYVRAYKGEDLQKAHTFGLGAAGLIVPQLRFGISAENLGNEDCKDYAPRILRLGLAQTFLNGDVTAHLDYRQRQRVALESTVFGIDELPIAEAEEGKEKPDERQANLSFSVRTLDLLRILGGYSRSLESDKRQSISGGLALVNDGFSFSYLLSRPYMDEAYVHQAVNLTIGGLF